MGGSGGGSYSNWQTSRIRDLVKEDADNTAAEYEFELSGLLGALLAKYNDRDVESVARRLAECKDILGEAAEASFDQLFGGSVAKHTFVDGLSDVDSLVVVSGSVLESEAPADILEYMQRILTGGLEAGALVTHGKLAVSISYPDGMEIQLLPALRAGGVLKIPAASNDGWSAINSNTFQEALTRRNAECGGKLVPTIKLAKAVIANFPEPFRLSGYHVESIAISAFKEYTGRKTTAAMLPALFEKAKDLVLSPIRDSTGQSVHVDEYLGEANSQERRSVSHLLNRTFKRMRNASAAQSDAQWRELFFDQE